MSRLALTIRRVVSLSLLAVIQPCLGPCADWYALDLQTKADVKRIPLEENTQGLKWTVGPFKPTDLVTGEKLPADKQDKRFCFRGSGKDEGNFAVFGGLPGRGNFSLGSTIALASTKGLRHLETSSWVYARYAGEPDTEYQVNLLYSDELDDGKQTVPGWIARAYEGATLLGSMEYPGVAWVDVRLVQDDDSLDFLARPAAYTEEEGGFLHAQPFDTLHSEMRLPSDDFTVGFGAFGIDKGGAVYTDMLWFLGPDLGPEPGTEEVFVFNSFGTIGSCLIDAKDILSVPEPDLTAISLARSQVNSALSTAISTMFTLSDGIKNGDFAEQTEAKTANKIGKQTYKKLDKVVKQLDKMLDKGQVNTGQLKGICKTLEDLTDRSSVGMANMLGIKASNFSQIDRGVHIDDLPDIF